MRQVHSFRIGDVLYASLVVFRQNLGTFLCLSLVMFTPAFALVALLPLPELPVPALSEEPDTEIVKGRLLEMSRVFGISFGRMAVLTFCGIWLQAAVIYAVVRTLRTRAPSLLETAWQSIRALGHACVVFWLGGLAILCGLLLFIVPGILAALMFFVAVPVAVVERRFGSALGRSHQLTLGHKWPIFGLLILLYSAVAVCGIGLTDMAQSLAPALVPYVQVLTEAVMGSVTAAVCAVCYHDLRMLKEGGRGSAIAEVFD